MRKALMLSAALLLTACGGGSPEPAPAIWPWSIVYSPSMPPTMAGSEGNWYFDFPTSDGVHYVYKNGSMSIRLGQTVTMGFSIVGDGTFVSVQVPEVPAQVRLFLQQAGDTLTASEPYKRWWSTNSVILKSGEFGLSAPLDPSQWTNVFGVNGALVPNEFANAVANLGHVGFTFGGNFYGHGVYVTNGNARFTLKQYLVQ